MQRFRVFSQMVIFAEVSMAAQKEYLTVGSTGKGEYSEKKSRFLGEIHPVTSEEEAAAVVAQARKRYYDARHHCYAWILGEDGSVKKASDDGEPSGTAGVPILKVLDGAGIRNAVAVVTRYFGGTLLGTGGLVRSYTQAAQAALKDARIVRMCQCSIIGVEIDYSLLDKTLYYLRQQGIDPYDQVYTDKVSFMLTIREDMADQICSDLTALSGASAQIITVDEGFFPLEAGGAD